MSWRCQLFASREAIREQFGFVPVGAMWPAPHMLASDYDGHELAANYRRDWQATRAPLWVKLPDGEFCVDSRAYNHEQGGYYGDGWIVTGIAPAITVAPSINLVGRYHGYLQERRDLRRLRRAHVPERAGTRLMGIRVFWLEPTDEISAVRDEKLYRRSDTGELVSLADAPIGAMWDASWMASEVRTGPDGITLVVRTPGGDWCVDAECNNCTRTQWGPKEIDGRLHDKVWLGRTHYCWVRHGDPRQPETMHVDKNGETCSAGGGSILQSSYHGFLHHGELVQC